MNAAPATDPALLADLLRRAESLQASATLRQVGSSRILGDLQVLSLEAPDAVVLTWDNGREQAPASGSEVILSVVVGDELHTLRTRLLTAVQPHLRVAWPSELLESGARAQLRVAAPDQSPLNAKLCQGDACRDALLLRLTESGMRLAVDGHVDVTTGAPVLVETALPGGRTVEVACRVQGVFSDSKEALPLRLDLVYASLVPDVQEALQRFIQARRTDRSEILRHPAVPREG